MSLLVLACGGGGGASSPASSEVPTASAQSDTCHDASLAVSVLGSGGPILDDERASTGYVVWIDGRARALVDLGPGAMLRFGEVGARTEDLDVVLITHLHVDHSADLSALLKTSSFGDRDRPLPIVGPGGTERFPSLRSFLGSILGPDGAYRYLGGFLEEGRPYVLEPREIDPSTAAPASAFEGARLTARAVGVPHGPVPALAYDVEVAGKRIAFMGDQRADAAPFVELVRGADLLVAHMAVGRAPDSIAAGLHATPTRLGQVAAEAEVGRVVLSHLMPRSLADLEANVSAVRAGYSGPITIAEDRLCIVLDE